MFATEENQSARSPRAQYFAGSIMSDILLPDFDNMSKVIDPAAYPLREIIEQRRLSALFQPILDLKSGAFIGYEGLIRGPADSPLHSPANLFGAAKQHGLSLELEMLSRKTVLEAFARQNLPGQLFLNVSPETLSLPKFRDGRTLEFMRELGIDPASVVIEITENQPTFDFEEMRSALLHYRSMGFQIAIDDLGEGFSSLRLWSELRPELIKIDMHFVQGVDQDPIKLQFLKSIQQIAEQCGTRVVAEGIETEAELRVIRDIGISLGQGYLIGRPNRIPAMQPNCETNRIIMASGISVFPCASGNGQKNTAEKLITYIEPVQPRTSIEEVLVRFTANPTLRSIPIVWDGKPLGIIIRHSFIEQFIKPFQRDLHGKKPCSSLIDHEPLLVEKNIPITELGHYFSEIDSRYLADDFIISESGRYIGVASSQDLLRELTKMQLQAARYANPLTFLPGNVPINEHIERLLLEKATFVACYCDLDNFKPFNDVYGYRKGDELIQLTGRILSWSCDPKLDFIGHVGGDDFILLIQSSDWRSRCEQALCAFEQAAPLMFNDEHRSASGYTSEGRDGKLSFHMLTSLSIGAVEIQPGQLKSHHEVSTAMSAAKKMAKKIVGNSLFIEPRNLS